MFEYEYKNEAFKYADVYVTNRFTLDTVKTTIDFNSSNTTTILKDYSNIQAFTNHYEKFSTLDVCLSMYDFDYGDIYVQFYDDAADKDKYCAPIIIQFTNAPTIYQLDTYKTNPSSKSIDISDEDNVFSSAYGSQLKAIPDTGRTDVLSQSNYSNYYNELFTENRLITNGLAADATSSVYGHPTYSIEYCSFIPSTFSKEYSIDNSTTAVKFDAVSAYLTVNTDDIETMKQENAQLSVVDYAIYTEYELPVININDKDVFVYGTKQNFTLKLTHDIANRRTDKWYRTHTKACADFKLVGLDPYWTTDDK